MTPTQSSRRSLFGGLLAALTSLFVAKTASVVPPARKPARKWKLLSCSTPDAPGVVTVTTYDANGRCIATRTDTGDSWPPPSSSAV